MSTHKIILKFDNNNDKQRIIILIFLSYDKNESKKNNSPFNDLKIKISLTLQKCKSVIFAKWLIVMNKFSQNL